MLKAWETESSDDRRTTRTEAERKGSKISYLQKFGRKNLYQSKPGFFIRKIYQFLFLFVLFIKRKNGELDDEILQLTGQVLVENPDIYTFWNVRKETILVIKNKT